MTQFNAVLVGAGGMGRTWAKAVRDSNDVRLTGWIDLRRDVAAQAAADLELADVAIDNDLERALADLRPDFLIDVSIPEAHHDVTITALRAGVPVLGEKPMAATLDQARAMVAEADRTGLLYKVSQQRRYDSGIQALRRLIQTQIGVLGMLTSEFFLGPHFGGFRDQMAHPLLIDMAIHTLDAARYISAADPVAVYCETWNPGWSWYAGDACATAVFEMTGGLRYTYTGSWCSEGHPTSWEAQWRAVGPNGTALWDGANPPTAEIVAARDGFLSRVEARSEAPDPTIATGVAGSLADFVHALRHGTTPESECHDNLKSLAMVFAAIESATTGQRVRIADLIG